LYANSTQWKARIMDVGEWQQNQWKWVFNWRRRWFEWEKYVVEEFYKACPRNCGGKGYGKRVAMDGSR